jgi:hypothetical protein
MDCFASLAMTSGSKLSAHPRIATLYSNPNEFSYAALMKLGFEESQSPGSPTSRLD